MSNFNVSIRVEPPMIYDVSIIPVSDSGELCCECGDGHVVVDVSKQNAYGWSIPVGMCAFCVNSEYDANISPSKFDLP